MSIPKLSFEIDYQNEGAGWICCPLVIDGQRFQLLASHIFPPFLGLLRFVENIEKGTLPAKFLWDEEGVGASFEATAHERVQLRVQHSTKSDPWINATMEKQALAQTFLAPLQDFSEHPPSA